MSYLNIRCTVCGSNYTLMTEELNVLALFKCSECNQHSVYVCGKVLLLNEDIMETGTDEQKFEHVLGVAQKMADKFSDNVLGYFDRIIDVNSSISIPEIRHRIKEQSDRKAEAEEERETQPQLAPSILSADASKISDQDVRDFVGIDLNLIDKKSYFEKIFGGNSNNN